MKLQSIFTMMVLANLSLFSCGSNDPVCALPAESLQPVGTSPIIAPYSELRVIFKNISIHDFNNLVVEEQFIGDLATQAISNDHFYFYQLYERAHIELSVGSKALELRPVDHVGEQPLEPGFYYTFSIDVDLDQDLIIASVEKGDAIPPPYNDGYCL